MGNRIHKELKLCSYYKRTAERIPTSSPPAALAQHAGRARERSRRPRRPRGRTETTDSPERGPTELRPASHFLTRDLKRQLMLAKIKKRLHSTVQPGFKPGDACLFDYRTLHRGMPNASGGTYAATGDARAWQDGMLWGSAETQRWKGKARPMLELTFASARYNDLLNFPPRSIFDSPRLPSST